MQLFFTFGYFLLMSYHLDSFHRQPTQFFLDYTRRYIFFLSLYWEIWSSYLDTPLNTYLPIDPRISGGILQLYASRLEIV
jgi:hypothetical protein